MALDIDLHVLSDAVYVPNDNGRAVRRFLFAHGKIDADIDPAQLVRRVLVVESDPFGLDDLLFSGDDLEHELPLPRHFIHGLLTFFFDVFPRRVLSGPERIAFAVDDGVFAVGTSDILHVTAFHALLESLEHGILMEQVPDADIPGFLASGGDHLAHKPFEGFVPAFPRLHGLRRLDVVEDHEVRPVVVVQRASDALLGRACHDLHIQPLHDDGGRRAELILFLLERPEVFP